MATIAQAAIAASVVMGLVSIPSASMAATPDKSVSSDLPEVSDSESIPKKVSRSVTQDGFEATVKTAFNKFSTNIDHGSTESSIETPQARLEVEQSPSETRWKLTSSHGSLSVTSSGEKVEETLETPSGTLEIVRENGAKTVSFEGSDREKVEEQYLALRERLESMKQQLQHRKKSLKKSGMPDVEVIVNETTAEGEEHAILVNKDYRKVDLEGWKLTDDSGSYTIPQVTLGSGEKLRIYSGKEWKGFEGSDLAWNNGGDTATLYNTEGTEVDSTSY